ncbi:MAG: ATP-binding protein [Clostridia bacterium]
MRRRIFISIFITALLTMLATGALVLLVVYDPIGAQVAREGTQVCIALMLAAMAVVLLIVARAIAKRIIAPINAVDLDTPMDNDTYDELSPLLLRIERQKQEIRARMAVLAEKQQEWGAVTKNMREGMVLLDGNADVLTINDRAAEIFRVDAALCVGMSILMLNRGSELQSVVEGVRQSGGAESLLDLRGRTYQLLANAVGKKNGMGGMVILMLDITDRQQAEQSRREFSANVSHELKTPLTSISGFAEIMMNGLVRPEDMQGFAGRIYQEANRLMLLVDDILRLSRLDEGDGLTMVWESVELDSLARHVCARLANEAQKHGVILLTQGDPALIEGIPHVLDELLFNLCDNAIKYNVPGGSVTISTICKQETVTLTVTDTGIGISAEHIPHVFERFYRADKSHSKETGGTGLGLSIAKHAAQVHGANISISSEVGVGTSVRVEFRR